MGLGRASRNLRTVFFLLLTHILGPSVYTGCERKLSPPLNCVHHLFTTTFDDESIELFLKPLVVANYSAVNDA